MKQLSNLFLTTLLLISCSSGDGMNKQAAYTIDPEIIVEVAENTRKEEKMDIGSMEIRYYEDDSLVTETFSNDHLFTHCLNTIGSNYLEQGKLSMASYFLNRSAIFHLNRKFSGDSTSMR